ncbi:hypothetical protein HYZ76_01380 [Candidatus Falkowbacteria bacterium]|nr:hypothetical protein [Candidatus Falkowbacteria bacterium]
MIKKTLAILLLGTFIFSLSFNVALAQSSCDIQGPTWLKNIGIPNGLIIPCDCLRSPKPGEKVDVNAEVGTPRPSRSPKPGEKVDVNACGLEAVYQVIVNVAQLILALTGAVALLMFTYGGVLWIIAAGNQEWIQKGKSAIIAAAVGIALVMGAWLIVNFTIYALVGGDIQNVTLFGQAWFKQP